MIDPLSEPSLGKLDMIPLFFFWGIPILLTGFCYYDNAMGPGTSWCAETRLDAPPVPPTPLSYRTHPLPPAPLLPAPKSASPRPRIISHQSSVIRASSPRSVVTAVTAVMAVTRLLAPVALPPLLYFFTNLSPLPLPHPLAPSRTLPHPLAPSHTPLPHPPLPCLTPPSAHPPRCILGGGLIKQWAALGWFILPICLVMGINIIAYGAIGWKLAEVVAALGDNPTTRNLIKFMTEMKACAPLPPPASLASACSPCQHSRLLPCRDGGWTDPHRSCRVAHTPSSASSLERRPVSSLHLASSP